MPETILINDNLRLHYIPMSKLKTTTLSVYIHRSLNEKEASMNALLPYVLKRACRLCPTAEESAKYLEGLYGAFLDAAVAKRGEDQIIDFEAETISDRYTTDKEPLLAKLTELVLSVLFEPVTENGGFLADIVEQEKDNALKRIKSLINDKRTYASLRCKEEMCKGEPYALSHYGTIEGTETITPQSLYEYYRKMITSSVIDFYVCGEADISSAADTIHEYTDSLSFIRAQLPNTEIHMSGDKVKKVTDRMEVTQGKLAVGFSTGITPGSGDCAALAVFSCVFGAGAHSKLFNNIREKLSLAYYASSQIDRYKGLVIVNAGVEFKNFEKAYDEALVQLEEIKKGNITDFEFDSSIKAIINNYNMLYDDQRMMAAFYLGEELAGTNDTIADKIKAVKAVTKKQVADIAGKLKLDTVYELTGKEEE